MEPVGIFIMLLVVSFFAFKTTIFFVKLILDRKELQLRVNILEAKCGEKVTDFNNLPPPPPRIEHDYYVPPPKPKPLIESDVLMFMIKTCHPDKFSTDSTKEELAKKAAKWLLDQKNKQKKQGF